MKSSRKMLRSKTYHLQVIVELDEDGKFVASCPALQGCYTQGDTFEEALTNVRDVIEMCLAELREEHRQVDLRFPEVVGIKTIEVTV
jgi:predicted RNase H-like HicB family nuclease